jgi:hypothetical protein
MEEKLIKIIEVALSNIPNLKEEDKIFLFKFLKYKILQLLNEKK